MVKKNLIFLTLISSLILPLHLVASPKLKTLYNSLDPLSVPQHLAFYDLFPNTPEGKTALTRAWELLSQTQTHDGSAIPLEMPAANTFNAIIALINRQTIDKMPTLDEKELDAIEKIAGRLANRKLKGYYAETEAAVLALPPEEIDLAKGLFLSQKDSAQSRRTYEALLDLMALQILAKLDSGSSDEQKIEAVNRFIFEEMRFRFPPHSLYAENIDVYTFLPSVLDSHRGVCLGVSILYLCLAQRLDLPLEMITPPGHIYVRYRKGDKIINIETTARGIDAPTELYLGIETRSLQQRTIKEVIGLAHFNHASTFWYAEQYEKAIASYEIAQPYLPGDKLLIELLGYNYLLADKPEKAKELLQQVKNHIPDYAIAKETLAEDYLNGNVGADGIKVFFMQVDENRESVLKKKEALEGIVNKYPKFRNGIFALAVTWLQLYRAGEALEVLKRFHAIEPNDPTAEYYLAVLHAQRYDYNKAWGHFMNVEKIVNNRNHHPKALKEFRRQLASISP